MPLRSEFSGPERQFTQMYGILILRDVRGRDVFDTW